LRPDSQQFETIPDIPQPSGVRVAPLPAPEKPVKPVSDEKARQMRHP
jgi:hypothetical protein